MAARAGIRGAGVSVRAVGAVTCGVGIALTIGATGLARGMASTALSGGAAAARDEAVGAPRMVILAMAPAESSSSVPNVAASVTTHGVLELGANAAIDGRTSG